MHAGETLGSGREAGTRHAYPARNGPLTQNRLRPFGLSVTSYKPFDTSDVQIYVGSGSQAIRSPQPRGLVRIGSWAMGQERGVRTGALATRCRCTWYIRTHALLLSLSIRSEVHNGPVFGSSPKLHALQRCLAALCSPPKDGPPPFPPRTASKVPTGPRRPMGNCGSAFISPATTATTTPQNTKTNSRT